MTPEDYASMRNLFTRALKELECVCDVFYDAPTHAVDWESVKSEYDIRQQLDQSGYWLTGDMYVNLSQARQSLEAMIGRAHARSGE